VVKVLSPFRPAELFWLCITLALLWVLAQPMSSPVATSGMDNRCAVLPGELPRRAQVREPEPGTLLLSEQVRGFLQQVADGFRLWPSSSARSGSSAPNSAATSPNGLRR